MKQAAWQGPSLAAMRGSSEKRQRRLERLPSCSPLPSSSLSHSFMDLWKLLCHKYLFQNDHICVTIFALYGHTVDINVSCLLAYIHSRARLYLLIFKFTGLQDTFINKRKHVMTKIKKRSWTSEMIQWAEDPARVRWPISVTHMVEGETDSQKFIPGLHRYMLSDKLPHPS